MFECLFLITLFGQKYAIHLNCFRSWVDRVQVVLDNIFTNIHGIFKHHVLKTRIITGAGLCIQ